MDVTYVLITPARNEENYIEKTINSVIMQTMLPKKWVIVDDGSTDLTSDIVKKYSIKYNFIQLVRLNGKNSRNFDSKVVAIKAGFEKIKDVSYDYIGFLDADVSFNSNYFEMIISKFIEDFKLGIAGGLITELKKLQFRRLNYNLNSVAGAQQLFRKQCYKDIGGYIGIKWGGIDALAEYMARMNGWKTKTIPEVLVFHHRRVGMNKINIRIKFQIGRKEFLVGAHPLFMFVKYFRRFYEAPPILGSIIVLIGYFYSAFFKKEERQISKELICYIHNEQKKRLKFEFLRLMKKI